MPEQSPEMKRILIDERDQCYFEKIRQSLGKLVVAVVGAGHVKGLIAELKNKHNLVELNQYSPIVKHLPGLSGNSCSYHSFNCIWIFYS